MGISAFIVLCLSGTAWAGTMGDSLQASTATLSGNAFSVGGSTFVVTGGQVGIGTASPQATLDVNGNIRTATGYAFKLISGASSVAISNKAGPAGSIATQAVSFGYTFTSAPVVTVSGNTAGGWLDCLIPTAETITTTGFTLLLTLPCAQTANGTYAFSWIAIGN